MLREGCEPLARRGQRGAGHPRSGDAQCAPTPANSLPLVGRLAAPRLAEGCSCDAGFASFVSLFEFLVVVSNSQKRASLASSLLGQHLWQIVRQRQSEISDFDDEPLAVAVSELFKLLAEAPDPLDEFRLVPGNLLSGGKSLWQSFREPDRLRGGSRTNQHDNGRPLIRSQIYRSKRLPQLPAVGHDKSRYLELVQPDVLEIERDADFEDRSQIEEDISPGPRPLIRPDTELDKLADPACEHGWHDRIPAKRSSEGV